VEQQGIKPGSCLPDPGYFLVGIAILRVMQAWIWSNNCTHKALTPPLIPLRSFEVAGLGGIPCYFIT